MKKLLLTLFFGILSPNSFALTTLWNRATTLLAINGTLVENRGSIAIDETTSTTIDCYYYGANNTPLSFTFQPLSFHTNQNYHIYVERSLSERIPREQLFIEHIKATCEDSCSSVFNSDFFSQESDSLLKIYCKLDDEHAMDLACDKMYAEESIKLPRTFNFPYCSLSSSSVLDASNPDVILYLAKVPFINTKKAKQPLVSNNIIQINYTPIPDNSLRTIPLAKSIVDWVEDGNTLRQKIYKPDEAHNLPLEVILANVRHGYIKQFNYHDEYGRRIRETGTTPPLAYSGCYVQINIPGVLYNLQNNCSQKRCACATNNGYFGYEGEYEIGITVGTINGEIGNSLHVSHLHFRVPKEKVLHFWHPHSIKIATAIHSWIAEPLAIVPSPYKKTTMFYNSPHCSSSSEKCTPAVDALNQQKYSRILSATRAKRPYEATYSTIEEKSSDYTETDGSDEVNDILDATQLKKNRLCFAEDDNA